MRFALAVVAESECPDSCVPIDSSSVEYLIGWVVGIVLVSRSMVVE